MEHSDEGFEDRTGEQRLSSKEVVVSFERFSIKMRLTLDDRFIEIVEVGFRRDFRAPEDRGSGRGYHDVSDLYET